MQCPSCQAENLDIDLKCTQCGQPLTSTGAHRMIGSMVLGQYELVDILGQGGMSVVYKGRHNLTDQEVALKILPPELAAHAQVKSRFLEEAKALAALDHANIVHLYNFGQENGCFVLAMQFIRGKTWERMIMENQRLDWTVSARITVDVLRALEYAHGRGVVHRDMKPSNVLVRQDDGVATVMDFGIAKMTTSTRLTATGQTMGTVRYMSPEQVRGQEVDLSTDLYSLGATLYESLTGDTPFDGNTHFEIMTKHLSEVPVPPSQRGVVLPAGLEQALLTSLAKKPADRFASARDFRKAIEAVLKLEDVGIAETMRLARDSLAPALRAGDVSKPTASAVAPVSTSPGRPAKATTLADKLEPSGAHPVARPSSTPWPVIIGAVVAVAATAVGAVLYVRRDRTPAATAPVRPERPAAFQPPGQAWTSQYDDGALGFYSTDPAVDAQAVRKVFTEAVGELDRFIAERIAGEQLAIRPLNVIAVPAAVLCSPATYTERKRDGTLHTSPVDAEVCKTRRFYYRTTDRSLLVRADEVGLPRAVREGVADFVQIHRPDLEDLVRDYQKTL
ncbi:MAG: protein kinase [Kofleriaceae bacterium]|jgi:serine/threonine protein kinase|nr:protein kinase [Kofleriaceae bacterium]